MRIFGLHGVLAADIVSLVMVVLVLSLTRRVSAFRSCPHGGWRTVPRRAYSKSNLQMMPEGPEVRSLIDYIDHSLCGSQEHYLVNASIYSGRYLEKNPTGWDILTHKIDGKPTLLKRVATKGKFIYFDFNDDFYVWSTLGMTGGWTLSPHRRHIRFALNFHPAGSSSDVTLYYYDQRNFGTLKISESKEELNAKLESLGANWLDETAPSVETFLILAGAAGKRKRPLCVFLMDQSKTSGIGNYVLSECLYRARIHPFACTSEIDEDGWTSLHESITQVLGESYESQRPVIDEMTNTMSKNKHKRYSNSLFTFRIYSRSVTSDTGNPVIKTLGTHKRSVYFDPVTQTKFVPEGFDLEETKKMIIKKKKA